MSLVTLSSKPLIEHLPTAKSVETSYRRQMMAGIVLIGAVFGGIGGWSAVAELSSAAVAPGQIMVSSSRQQVQSLEGGIVAELLVKDGALVKEGDVLVRLDITQAQSQAAVLQAQSDTYAAALARLRAERDGSEAIAFPADLLARQTEPAVADVIANQTATFNARKATIEGQTSILQQRITQLKKQRDGLVSQSEAQQRQIALIEDELKGLRDLFQKGYASRTRILALERESERIRGERGEILGNIARTTEAVGEAELQILQQKKSFQEEVASQLTEMQARLSDATEKLVAAKDVLARRELRAPRDGYVQGLSAHTVGGVIPAGRTVLEVIPTNDELVVEAMLQPLDIDNVKVGQLADIRLSALSSRTTPVLEGEVVTVSADAFTDERTGATYYKAKVKVPKEQLALLNGQNLHPGMPAEVMIKTGDRTALHYMISPLTDVWAKSFREH
ncbi:MAG TPA: HlyD family type I secretion periplasmic adaptor subunit [Azospirillaceae bacterium]|nr:HlyD family type I secretion periplasmic adaptor subunit [Azospirillaceae bacterium]